MDFKSGIFCVFCASFRLVSKRMIRNGRRKDWLTRMVKRPWWVHTWSFIQMVWDKQQCMLPIKMVIVLKFNFDSVMCWKVWLGNRKLSFTIYWFRMEWLSHVWKMSALSIKFKFVFFFFSIFLFCHQIFVWICILNQNEDNLSTPRYIYFWSTSWTRIVCEYVNADIRTSYY